MRCSRSRVAKTRGRKLQEPEGRSRHLLCCSPFSRSGAPARDPAAVIPLNRGSHHAAALSWADGDTTGPTPTVVSESHRRRRSLSRGCKGAWSHGPALTACSCRRGDRMSGLIAVVHMSLDGTFETCPQILRMSVHRGRPECAGRPARSRWCKSITMKE